MNPLYQLLISYGAKKIKSDQVSMPQFVITSMRILYHLMESKQIDSYNEIKHYLTYVIKCMDLNTVTYTNDGYVICRSFNSLKGCIFHFCKYAHVCNKKLVDGKDCGLGHPCSKHGGNSLGIVNGNTCVKSSLNVLLWLEGLKDDPDKEFLSDGIINGFQIYSAKFKPAEMHNYASTTEPVVKGKVEQTLLEEIAEGNYIVVNEKPTIISALKAVPKPDSDEIRLINDCRQPKGSALNDYAEIDSFNSKVWMMPLCSLEKGITWQRLIFVMHIAKFTFTSYVICQYAAFLARSLKYNSIRSYLGIIGLLPKEFGLVYPLTGNWMVQFLSTGMKRVKG